MYDMTLINIHIFPKACVHTWVEDDVQTLFPICLFIPGAAIHKGGKNFLYAWLIFGSGTSAHLFHIKIFIKEFDFVSRILPVKTSYPLTTSHKPKEIFEALCISVFVNIYLCCVFNG